MLLAAPDDIRIDLGFDGMANIMAAILAALHTAEAHLASALGTPFALTALTDHFYVEEPGFARGSDVKTVFRLTRGFVVTNPPIIATLYSKSSTFGIEGGTPSILDPGDISAAMLFNPASLEKGVLTDLSTVYRRRWVDFDYMAGFAVSNTDPTSYAIASVPTWLQEAAKLDAKISLQSNPSLQDVPLKLDVKWLQAQLNMLLSSHLRYTPTALLPMGSS